jgi:hypothetical protein
MPFGLFDVSAEQVRAVLSVRWGAIALDASWRQTGWPACKTDLSMNAFFKI